MVISNTVVCKGFSEKGHLVMVREGLRQRFRGESPGKDAMQRSHAGVFESNTNPVWLWWLRMGQVVLGVVMQTYQKVRPRNHKFKTSSNTELQ